MGRKAVPTALRLVDMSKKARNQLEPKPSIAPGVPACPEALTGEARSHWESLAGELHSLGLLTAADLGLFTLLCEAWGRWRGYEAKCQEVGLQRAIELGYRSAADRAERQYHRAATDFGLSPSSRTKLKALPPKPTDNTGASRERLFGGGLDRFKRGGQR